MVFPVGDQAQYERLNFLCPAPQGHARSIRPCPLLALMALIATLLLAAPAKEVVREQRSFTVNGSKEVWRLIWRGTADLLPIIHVIGK